MAANKLKTRMIEKIPTMTPLLLAEKDSFQYIYEDQLPFIPHLTKQSYL